MITITQLSDTHFSVPGNRSHGGFGYDTNETFRAVFDHAFAAGGTELAVVTGDVADHGQPDEYLVAIEALSRIPVPTNVLPGNHDFDTPLKVSVPRPGLNMDRTQRVGSWLFVFADSNHLGREIDDNGRLVDRQDRIEAEASLGETESAWIGEMIDASDAPNVFIWLHHPPGMPGSYGSAVLDAEVADLVGRYPSIRGFGAGHIHSDSELEIAERPVFVCPALTISFDFENWTTLPPGYRTYRFDDDGSVESTCHLLDDARWPRIDLPEPVIRHFKGEMGWDELMAELAGPT
ncbi:MAG: metallophosphoesterase family protein [Acidimicrobiales bacterium]